MATHRRAVSAAIVETTWALVRERGLLAVTMSQIAESTGIGRATLYKYFPDVEAILSAGHEQHVTSHLAHLRGLQQQPGSAGERLEAVLTGYAMIAYHRERHGTPELSALLHKDEHVTRAQQELVGLFAEVLTEAAEAGQLREDVVPDEMAQYCLHALSAAGSLPSEAAVRRLVDITLAGLGVPSTESRPSSGSWGTRKPR
jgi:AcrR family transcriptional regulator